MLRMSGTCPACHSNFGVLQGLQGTSLIGLMADMKAHMTMVVLHLAF